VREGSPTRWQLRRFWLVPVDEELPDESTVKEADPAAGRAKTLAARRDQMVEQIRTRLAGEPIEDRLLSLVRPRSPSDPHGQAGQDDRLRLPRAASRGDAEHETGRAA
jgi:hypothetical protein